MRLRDNQEQEQPFSASHSTIYLLSFSVALRTSFRSAVDGHFYEEVVVAQRQRNKSVPKHLATTRYQSGVSLLPQPESLENPHPSRPSWSRPDTAGRPCAPDLLNLDAQSAFRRRHSRPNPRPVQLAGRLSGKNPVNPAEARKVSITTQECGSID